MKYSYYISNLIKEISLSIHKDIYLSPEKRELLTKILESFIPIVNNTLEGNDNSVDGMSKLILNINNYIKEELLKNIDNSLYKISDYLSVENIDNYSIENINSFIKELDNLIENHLNK